MPKKLLQKGQIEKAECESQIHCSSSSPSPIRKTKDEFGLVQERHAHSFLYLNCFLLFMAGFSALSLSSRAFLDSSVSGSSGRVECRNFLPEPTWWHISFSIFLPLIHFSIIFMCVLLCKPLMFDSC